jgi:hypothetical protein
MKPRVRVLASRTIQPFALASPESFGHRFHTHRNRALDRLVGRPSERRTIRGDSIRRFAFPT